MILFRPSKEINYYEEEIRLLNEKNLLLKESSDSIISLNNDLQVEIDNLNENVDSVNSVLNKNEEEINKLKRRKGEVFNHVSNMDVNDVICNIADYLKRNH